MGFLQNLFGKKEEPINSYADFWKWFARHEHSFYNVIKSRSQPQIEKEFFNKLEPALAQVKSEIYFMTGMYDDNTVELVLAADGAVRNIVFIEELVNAAPPMNRWKFTALKPALGIEDTNIEMNGFTFNSSNIRFYPNVKSEYPDEIDITIVHDAYNEKNKDAITNGCYIFLDNFLGELQFAETIDNLEFTGRDEAEQELIPIEKLKDYLVWRQKEFVEKYETTTYNAENDAFSIMEAKLQSGLPLIACINTVLLEWDAKASHPWIAVVEIEYDGTNFNGLPEKPINDFLYKIEDAITQELKQVASNLPIGRQSSKNLRKIYYACKDFRESSKSIYAIQRLYEGEVKMSYRIYKDKYWQTLDHFRKRVQ
jgi:hypothetical protein